MAQDPSQIADEIAQRREVLEGHIHELEAKMGKVTDWRTYAWQRPLAIAAGVFGAGLVLALLFVRSRYTDRIA